MNAITIAIFIGGALGSMVREFIMILVPHLNNGFPLDIFVANISAAFILGFVMFQHRIKKISDDMIALFGVGALGGLSTFSSFIYGAFTEISKPDGVWVSTIYLVSSTLVGLFAAWLGLHLADIFIKKNNKKKENEQ